MDAARKRISIDSESTGAGPDYQPLDRFNAFSDAVFAVAGVVLRVLFQGAAFTIQSLMLEFGVIAFQIGCSGSDSWTILRSSFIRLIRSET